VVQVSEAVQIGGLQSAVSQLAGSWQGYRYDPSYPQLVNRITNGSKRFIGCYDLR
jgi:hypothetical protein